MSRKQLLGAVMLMLLFGGMFVMFAVQSGIAVAMSVFGAFVGIAGWIGVAIYLLGNFQSGEEQ